MTGQTVAQVLIRDLDDKTLKRLKKRAADNHRSLQKEIRAIITRAVSRSSAWDWLKRRSVGNLTKAQIDAYIRAERDSWHDSF